VMWRAYQSTKVFPGTTSESDIESDLKVSVEILVLRWTVFVTQTEIKDQLFYKKLYSGDWFYHNFVV
jgi:hypothetical protein